MKYPCRVDKNQPKLVEALRKAGWTVAHTHTIGRGFPDLVIAKPGRTRLVEVKDADKPPSARKLTPDEAKFHAAWPDDILILESIEDVLKLNTETP